MNFSSGKKLLNVLLIIGGAFPTVLFCCSVISHSVNIRLVLKSTEEAFSYSTYSIHRANITSAKKSPHNLDHAGFPAIINTSNLKGGNHTVGLLIPNDSVGTSYKNFNKSIMVSRPVAITPDLVVKESVDFSVYFDEVVENAKSFNKKGKYEFVELDSRRSQADINLKSLVNEYYIPIVGDYASTPGENNFSYKPYIHQIPQGKYDVGLLVDNSSHHLKND